MPVDFLFPHSVNGACWPPAKDLPSGCCLDTVANPAGRAERWPLVPCVMPGQSFPRAAGLSRLGDLGQTVPGAGVRSCKD